MAVNVRSGDLRRRISLRRDGQEYARPWANVEPLSGRELLLAQQISAEANTQITIRYRKGVQAGDEAVYGTTVYEIGHVADLESRHIALQLMCKVVT